jgi:Tfp pilus assembly protein PilE
MSILMLIVVVMVVTILSTITLASVSYGAFRMRERRAPRPQGTDDEPEQFFERVRLAPVSAEP